MANKNASENINVMVRVRPQNEEETKQGGKPCLHCLADGKTIECSDDYQKLTFKCTKCVSRVLQESDVVTDILGRRVRIHACRRMTHPSLLFEAEQLHVEQPPLANWQLPSVTGGSQ